jgi:methylated-DNA-[protein]-cysteine S-methyltransferase
MAVFATPLGPLHAAAADEGVVGLELLTTDEAFAATVGSRTGLPLLPPTRAAGRSRALAHLAQLERELAEHFDGVRKGFVVSVILEGLSAWDRRVLDAVRSIPRGTTASYAEIARRIGAPGAARAVGSAVGRNPVGVVIPCHRVVRSDGTLGGYGGSWIGSREELLDLKERLLALEGVSVPPRSPAQP